ncbi:L-glutamate gamma-semialdehyde dehydrogenase [Anaerolinea thermophila]|uniref:L-glutamate gamma-semialdehyde dehydrogenase n=1 Tax=Anaerolinea thermophila (strain DSM 14523 / JCM 11388 / NBRC 100420 / UNI-1) TaxID=926569 RepID=E8MZ95_ANATU|nr:L-glutamate gamma-semialdehyde dehydrogenase [Anaerolinea thermophila]BAJ62238.1 aldehyde dehydrogenase [Anaerolinea thermophila UNI-1]
MTAESPFKLTYATMFNPPEELHTRFEEALAKVKAGLGKEYGMIIDGKERFADEKFVDHNPANTNEFLGIFQKGTVQDAHDAVAAAKKAFYKWSHTPWQERVALIRKAADLIDQRIFEIGAAVALEVGKNRMEALGDVAETADLFRYACDSMEKNNGFIVEMGRDPLTGFQSTNFSVLRPYGVWLVISPFNFPAALTGGPSAAALVTGNTLIMKPATDTPWTARLLAECLRDAGIPDGVFNYVTGPGSTLGQALIDHPDIAGVTFTGSYDVGMKIYRDFAQSRWVRPTILELGGKNPAIVSRHANLEDAAVGIVRSAFGLQGQKCSACSRVFIEEPVYDELVERLVALTNKLTIGDPTARNVYMGPVINASSYRDYQNFAEELHQSGRVLTGGKILTEGEYAKGYFVTPTLVADLPADHRLWQVEMFVPITTIAKVSNLEEAMTRANEVMYGLTAGFYGSPEEVEWFFDRIEAGVTYANRPQGATTGAWPGFQPFGGWKASGASGKNAGGVYYLPLYMHEQIRTLVKRL